jgi:hypothetical protein
LYQVFKLLPKEDAEQEANGVEQAINLIFPEYRVELFNNLPVGDGTLHVLCYRYA